MTPDHKFVIVICGPTAVGKTSLAIELALELNTEIISADSRQCYREMNIGVAKPSEFELQQVRHYFINSHSIKDDVNAGSFEKYALQMADHIFSEHDVAVMVGGTGLYINAFCDGLDHIPEVSSVIREKVVAGYTNYGLVWLQDEVRRLDPLFWGSAEQQNPQRLMRALEVHLATNRSIIAFRNRKKVKRSFKTIKIGLELPREILNGQIHNRVDSMIAQGLAEEVNALLPSRHLNALQTVGYKELFSFADGMCTLPNAIENIKTNTRHYAKRQMTWFKKDPDVQWHTAGPGLFTRLLPSILKQFTTK